MTVAVDGTTSKGQIDNTTQLTISHTATGSNRAVVVGVAYGAGDSASTCSATYGGTAMTKLGVKSTNNQTGLGFAAMFGLVAPATGAQSVVINGPSGAIGAGVTSFTGADQTTPFGTAVLAAGSKSGGSGHPTASVSSASGDVVVDAMCYGSALSGGIGNTGTLEWNEDINGDSAAGNGAGSSYAGSSTVTVGYAPTPDDFWGLVAVDVKSVGGSALTGTPADGVGITDSATAVVAAVRSQSDPVGITDDAESAGESLSGAESIHTTQTPDSSSNDAHSPRNLGVDFVASEDGVISTIRWYAPGTTFPATVDVALWDPDVSMVTPMATGSGTATEIGWVDVDLDTPQDIENGHTYTASVWISLSSSSTEPDYGFTDGGLDDDIVNGHLTGLANTGRFLNDSPSLAYPSEDPIAFDFFVDVVFQGVPTATTADPVGITDDVSFVVTAVRTITDPVGVADTGDLQEIQTDYVFDVDEDMGLTDDHTNGVNNTEYVENPTEAVGITDVVIATKVEPGGPGLMVEAANAVLNVLAAQYRWIRLHTNDPGPTGNNNLATNADRQQVTWGDASGATLVSITDVEWDDVPATELYTHFSAMSAISGGTPGFTGALTGESADEGDDVIISAGALSAFLPVAT